LCRAPSFLVFGSSSIYWLRGWTRTRRSVCGLEGGHAGQSVAAAAALHLDGGELGGKLLISGDGTPLDAFLASAEIAGI
jgi:hypothetical protein